MANLVIVASGEIDLPEGPAVKCAFLTGGDASAFKVANLGGLSLRQ